MEIEFQSPYGKVSEQQITDIRNEIIKLWYHKSDMTKALVCFNKYQNIVAVKNIYCEIILSFQSGKHFIHTIEANFEGSAMEAVRELRNMNYQQEIMQRELIESKSNVLVA